VEARDQLRCVDCAQLVLGDAERPVEISLADRSRFYEVLADLGRLAQRNP
jgi:hypothetical protein